METWWDVECLNREYLFASLEEIGQRPATNVGGNQATPGNKILIEGTHLMRKIGIRSGGRIIVLAVLLFFVTTPVSATEITDNLKATIDSIINVVTDESIQDKTVRRQKLRKIIGKKFNYMLMVRSSLGKKKLERQDFGRKSGIY